MNSIRAWIQLLIVLFLLGACASTDVRRTTQEPTGPEPGLYGIRGGSLVRLAPDGGAIGAQPSAELADVTALTFDPFTERFYGVSGTSSAPTLIAIDAGTGEATSIGTIDVPGVHLTLVEAIAFHPGERTLYAAGGRSTYRCNVLFTVDPATAKGQQVARVQGTIQDEIDAMTFAGDVLYAVDGAGGSSALYRLDTITGQASRAGNPFSGTVTDLAFDPSARRLLGASKAGGLLLTFSPGGEMSETETPGGLEASVTGLAFIFDPGLTLFGDGFESGDASAWSGSEKEK